MPWLGRKNIAFIPLHRPNAHPPDDPIPADWPAEILRRVYYDPNAFPNLPDRSLRTYIHRVSSGLADLDATVLPMEILDQQDVPPDALEKDWTDLLKTAAGRPIAFPVVSYSSAAENGSSLERQADFVTRMRRFLAHADGRRLLFARWVDLRDAAPEEKGAASGAIVTREKNRAEFLAHRGLQAYSGEPKPAWRAWAKGP